MTSATTPHDSGRMIRALSLPGLIRLVSDLDDHGPLSRRRGSLQAAFDDLTADQLRLALDRARAFGLVHGDADERVRYRLTPRGEGLADVYDTAARWARTHQYPQKESDFVTRVQRTLTLLSQTLATTGYASGTGEACGLPASGSAPLSHSAMADLNGPQSALTAWLQTGPSAPQRTKTSCRQTVDEMEPAA
ncbi:hypothetical protein [Streptomyces sp. MNP-20]|uniref:hypothetical protein n=1 Tax=Streptomyces sp. MNP-20 TaxID=2721165 RepID=UPI0015543568|nr:hypothetical protein [Streptomyces sp. MNP-20]